MKIATIKQVVCYNTKDFIEQLTSTTNILQENNQEVEIQYAFDKGGIYSALIIGREHEHTDNGSRKTIRQTIHNNKA